MKPSPLPAIVLFATLVTAALGATERPPLFFREDFAETPAETPITQAHIANKDVVLSLHGPGRDGIKKSNHDHIPNDPYYVWSGTADGNWAVSLRHRDAVVDLSGSEATVHWRSKQSGFRHLHLIVQLEDGAWLVSEQSDAPAVHWRERVFRVADLTWRELNIESIAERGPVEAPDLSRVQEIGWTDLMTGGGSPASSRLDWIAVHGATIPRSGGQK